MRVLLIINLFLVCSLSYGQTNSFVLKKDIVKKISPNKSYLYLIYVNPSDCYNCNLATNYVPKELEHDRTFVLLDNVDSSLVKSFLKTFNLPDSSNYIISKELVNILKPYAKQSNCPYSYILEISNQIGTMIPLKSFKNKSSFSVLKDKIIKSKLQGQTEYYRSIHNPKRINNKTFLIGKPKGDIISISNEKIKDYTLVIDSNNLKVELNYILNTFKGWGYDTVKHLNNYSKSMIAYNKTIKPMGLKLLAPYRFFEVKDKMFLEVDIRMATHYSEDDISFGGNTCISEIIFEDSLIHIKKVRPINHSIDSSNIIIPTTLFFFDVSEDGNELTLSIARSLGDTTYPENIPYKGSFVLSKDSSYELKELEYISRDLKKKLDPKNELQQAVFEHKIINDFTFFTHSPIVMSKKDRMQNYLPESTEFYKIKHISYQNNKYYLFSAIGKIYYFLVLDNEFNIEKIHRLPSILYRTLVLKDESDLWFYRHDGGLISEIKMKWADFENLAQSK